MNADRWLIVDLDGTLSDHHARRPYAEQKQWDIFHARCKSDPVNPLVQALMQSWHDAGNKVAILTGRPERYREVTLDWLKMYYVTYDQLIMRPDKDKRPDNEYKFAMWHEYFNLLHRPVALVLEDRDKVVRMWRSLGLTCWQVAEGAY